MSVIFSDILPEKSDYLSDEAEFITYFPFSSYDLPLGSLIRSTIIMKIYFFFHSKDTRKFKAKTVVGKILVDCKNDKGLIIDKKLCSPDFIANFWVMTLDRRQR